MSTPIPLMTRIALSRKLGIPASRGNPTLYVQADGRNNKLSVSLDWEPWLDLGPDGRSSETLYECKTYLFLIHFSCIFLTV